MPKHRPSTSDNYASQVDGLSPPNIRQDPKGHQTLERFHSKTPPARKHFINSKGGAANATRKKGVTLPKFSWDKDGDKE